MTQCASSQKECLAIQAMKDGTMYAADGAFEFYYVKGKEPRANDV